MSQLNALGEGGLNSVLTRRLSINGGPPSPTVEPALFPGITLESERPEWGWLKGEIEFRRQIGVVVGAGRSSIELFNPSRAALAVVKSIDGSAANPLLCWVLNYVPGVAGTPGGGVIGHAIDGRSRNGAITGSGQCTITTDNILAVKGGFSLAAITATMKQGPFVLPPFSSLYIAANADAVAITYVNLVWTERRAEPGELV